MQTRFDSMREKLFILEEDICVLWEIADKHWDWAICLMCVIRFNKSNVASWREVYMKNTDGVFQTNIYQVYLLFCSYCTFAFLCLSCGNCIYTIYHILMCKQLLKIMHSMQEYNQVCSIAIHYTWMANSCINCLCYLFKTALIWKGWKPCFTREKMCLVTLTKNELFCY